jgi:SAM-dependent methyltransferase
VALQDLTPFRLARVSHAELLDAVWAAVPPDAEPERFAVRRAWLLERVEVDQAVLDYGCGAGEFAAALGEQRVTAVDAAAEAVRRARARGVDARLVEPDSALPFDDDAFDVVWLGETLEHLVDPVGALHEIRRVLRPRGRLLATTPDHPPGLIHALADDPEAFAEHFSPRTDHLRFFNERSLRALLGDLGFQDVEVASDGGTLFAQARW